MTTTKQMKLICSKINYSTYSLYNVKILSDNCVCVCALDELLSSCGPFRRTNPFFADHVERVPQYEILQNPIRCGVSSTHANFNNNVREKLNLDSTRLVIDRPYGN